MKNEKKHQFTLEQEYTGIILIIERRNKGENP